MGRCIQKEATTQYTHTYALTTFDRHYAMSMRISRDQMQRDCTMEIHSEKSL